MKIGTLGYATNRGLGHLVRDFYLNGIITDVLVVNHASIPTNTEWYPNAIQIPIRQISSNSSIQKIMSFCKEMNAMVFFETPFVWEIINFCKSIGVKTYLFPMHECTPKHYTKYLPNCFLCPSDLDVDYFKPTGIQCIRVTIPVDNNQWKLRTHAKHFIHNGGYLGLRGREGTEILIDSLQYIKSNIKLTIRVQENVSKYHQTVLAKDNRTEYINRTIPKEELFSIGDCYIAPQKFNGMSLPLQEAFAAGLPIITTNRYPTNCWLPNELMFEPESKITSAISGAYLEMEECVINPITLANCIDYWYNKDLSEFSYKGKSWGENNSWNILKEFYRRIIHEDSVCSQA